MRSYFHTVVQTGFYTIIAMVVGFYFYYVVDTSLIFFIKQPAFFFDRYFIDQYLIVPGGLNKLCAYFFSQFLYNNITGSAITVLLLLLPLIYQRWFYKLSGISRNDFFLSLIPVALLLAILTDYNAGLQIITAFHFFSIFLIINLLFNNKATSIRLIIAVVSNVLLFYVAGGFTTIVFTITLSIYLLVTLPVRKGLFYAFVNLATTAITILLYSHFSPYFLPNMIVTDLFYSEISIGNKVLTITTFAFIPLLFIACSVSKKWISAINGKISLKKAHTILLPSSALILFAAFLILIPRNPAEQKFKIQKAAAENQWDQVLELSKEIVPNERKDFFQINRAMYHKGILLEKGFTVQQWYGEHGLILTPYYNSQVLMLCSDLYHEMGFIKGSLHWAYEAQTKFKLAPNVLKRIITDNLLLGNLVIAQKFNLILSKSVTHKLWTKNKQFDIDNYDSFKDKIEPEKFFDLSLVRESYSNTQHPQNDLAYILDEHPNNNMAFEYLMFHAMLRHDLKSVITYSQLLETQNYQHIPRHIEEALVMAQSIRENLLVDTGNLKISNDTKKRFIDFTSMLMKFKREKSVSQAAIQNAHGDTFWYYISFVSPITTKREFKEKEL